MDDELSFGGGEDIPSVSPSPAASLLEELEESLDDVGAIKKQYMSKILPDDGEFNSSQVPIDTISKREVQDLIESIPKPMIQKPIQPGSSPNDEENRFLCWNNIGIIRAQNGQEDQSIDVMFHDAAKQASLNFKNEQNFSLATLSEDAIVVGSNGRYGTGPSTVQGINLLESNRDQRKWGVELPHVELIEALAAGTGFIAVVTDQRNLRFFTNGGMQSYVFTLPGQVLCVSAAEKQLMIIYHNGAGHSDDQNLNMFVYHVDLFNNRISQTLAGVPVALSKRSPLSWAGFSDEGTPCTYDYSGMLRMYRHDLGKAWIPLLDLRELTTSALDHYFLVGVSESSQTVRAVKCRRSRYPDFNTETAEVFEFSLPMCDMDTDRGKLEEEQIRLRLAKSSDANEKLLVNTVLRLFAIYLKEDKEDLAKGLIYMMPKEHMNKLPEFAWKINRRQYFIDSLNKAIEERESSDVQCKNPDNGDEDDDNSIVMDVNDLKPLNQADVEDSKLKPIPLDELLRNNNNNKVTSEPDDDSGDENYEVKRAKKAKNINYNLFSKKRPRNV